MTWCHQSQVTEWLPWVGRHDMAVPKTVADWETILRARFARHNVELGLNTTRAVEVFRITAWGVVPELGQLLQDFPSVWKEGSNLAQLEARLRAWNPR